MSLAGAPLVRLHAPRAEAIPLVFDSPHSGTLYPDDFGHAAPMAVLRQAEDTHVERLFATAPAAGAVLIEALFPRSYIDANRALDDIDPDLLGEPWPEQVPPGRLRPGEKCRLGLGLVRRMAQAGVPLYARKLSVAEVRGRIERCYQPYHALLEETAAGLHRRFGAVWHVDCHSMAAQGSEITPDGDAVRADFVLGDRDGTTCAPEFTELARATLVAQGYDVRVNDPYKGAELVRRHGAPAARRHSLQIEINRRLYMNEATREPSAGFDRTAADLGALVTRMADYVRASLKAR